MNLEEVMTKNKEVFLDTQKYLSDNYPNNYGELRAHDARCYSYDNLLNEKLYTTVAKADVISTILYYHEKYPNYKIAVLDFADALVPGGSVAKGAIAQEEELCRCTTLYPVLKSEWMWYNYYLPNKKSKDYRYADKVVYIPDIYVIKDSDYKLLDNKVKIDVIEASAPCLINKDRQYDYNLTYRIQHRRDNLILNIATRKDADILVLGAFGCGCFYNSPEAVAGVFKHLLGTRYRYRFKEVVFPIYDNPNHDIFKSILIGNIKSGSKATPIDSI